MNKNEDQRCIIKTTKQRICTYVFQRDIQHFYQEVKEACIREQQKILFRKNKDKNFTKNKVSYQKGEKNGDGLEDWIDIQPNT